jgi:hypothetical protein
MDLIFWMINIAISMFIAILTFTRVIRNKELEKEQRTSAYYWVFFLVIWTIANLSGLINREYYNFSLDIDIVSVFLVNLAILTQIYYVERNIRLYKYPIFTIIQLVVTVGYAIVGNFRIESVLISILIVLMIVGFSFLPLIYLYIAIKSSGPIRSQTFKIAIAIILIAFGTMIQSQNVSVVLPDMVITFQNTLSLSWVILPTCCSLAGVILLFSTYLIKFIIS